MDHQGVNSWSTIILFNIYVNNLPDVANYSTINLYADNATIYVADYDPGALISKNLLRITEWIEMNGLKTNVRKTLLMVLSRKQAKPK